MIIFKSKYILIISALCVFLFGFTNNASAGTIIKGPAYLGLGQGLIGYWTFDGKDIGSSGTIAKDTSGKGNNGTLTGANGLPVATAGKIGQALNFDGADDYVTLGTTPTALHDLTLGNFTMCAWIKPSSAGENNLGTIIDNFSDGSGGSSLLLRNIGGDINTYQMSVDYSGINLLAISQANDIDLNTWQFICGLHNASTKHASLYKNGVKLSLTTDTAGTVSPVSDSGIEYRFGNRSIDTTRTFKGAIDDIRIYSRALSDEEIARIYKIGSGSKINRTQTNSSLEKGIVAHWTFDGPDVSGTTIKDISGHGLNGTTTGSPLPTPGILGQGILFQTQNTFAQYVTIQHDPTYFGNLTNGAIYFWAKNASISAGSGVIGTTFSKNAAGANNGDLPCGFLQDGRHRCSFDDGSTSTNLETVSACSVGTWCQIVYTWNNNGANTIISAYLNGVFQTSETRVNTMLPLSSNIQITFDSNGATGRFKGIMDDVRIYNRTLSASEINLLYNQSKSKFNSSLSNKPFLDQGLLGHWTFDGKDIGSSGTIAKDTSGKGNNLAITEAAPVAGKIGQALNFDGINDVVNNNASSLGFAGVTTNVTFANWVYLDSTSENGAFIKVGGSTSGYGIGVGNSTFDNAGNHLIAIYEFTRWINTGINIGTGWHHTALVIDSSGFPHIYLDGVQIYSDTTGAPSAPTATFGIGAYGTSTRFVDAMLDDVRVYNRALSAEEIKALYNVGH